MSPIDLRNDRTGLTGRTAEPPVEPNTPESAQNQPRFSPWMLAAASGAALLVGILIFWGATAFIGEAQSSAEAITSVVALPIDSARTAVSSMQSAKMEMGLTMLRQHLSIFRSQHGRNPGSLDELLEYVGQGVEIRPPKGFRFEYDAENGTITTVRDQ